MISSSLLIFLTFGSSAAAARAQVKVSVEALGDSGHVYAGQPAYVDVTFENLGQEDVVAPAGALVEAWELEDPSGAAFACTSEDRPSYLRPADKNSSQVVLRAGERRTIKENFVQSICPGSLRKPGRWRFRVGLSVDQKARVYSDWRTLEVIQPAGREAEAIAAYPASSADLTEYLKKYGDTAIAGRLLRRQNEIEAGLDWVPTAPFGDRASRVGRNQRWLEGTTGWRLRVTEQFLRRHPDSYFAPDLQSVAAAMYASTGDVDGAERMAALLGHSRPDEAAAIRDTAARLRSGKAMTR